MAGFTTTNDFGSGSGSDMNCLDPLMATAHNKLEGAGDQSWVGNDVLMWSPCEIKWSASSRRSETSSLSKILCKWFFTVCSLINIFSAISLFLKP